jgi:hypothetical protein
MRLPETITEFRNALIDAAELGAMKALERTDKLKPYMSERKACRMYGAGIVRRWNREGLVIVRKDGSDTASKRISCIEIEAVAKASNRATYLTTEERIKSS